MAPATTMDVTVVACGAPKRGMGWYHAKQLLDGRVAGARLSDVVEPFFLGAGKDTPPGKDFAQWSAGAAAKGVSLHASIGDMPRPSGPKLVIICGRTSDNPRLFREAVDRGFSHVYLEKPGAPTVAELEEMAAYAKAKGVPVYMGFNRNFSKYVRLAQDFMAQAPADAAFTLGRNDCFNTPESLDECFERNAEGMLKNMMIHEIVVLISYFGLKVSSIKEIVADKSYTCVETRKGFTDLSKMGCTIKTVEGREFKLWGDRSDGEYGEAVVTAGGKELFKAVRPDAEVSKTAEEIEKAEPGCMPYFYLQDGEYLALKKQVVEHMASGKPGSPDGVASVETAIEGLKLCDCITEALMSGGTQKFAPAPRADAGAAYMGRFDGSESKHASPAMAALAGKEAAESDPSSLPTSTKWSVLSSRVEGLVAELAQVVGKQDAYCVSQSKCEGPAMQAVREKMLSTPWAQEWAEKRTMFSYGEEMSTDPLEAMLLKQLTFMCAPRRVLEIGMFVGYGSVAMLEGSSSAQVVSLEIDPYLKGWLSSCLADAGLAHLGKRHEVVIGPALDSLPKLSGEFDLVFVDANKAEYKRYVELILEHKLLSASGMIICDNILYNGYPYVHSHFDSQPARRGFGDAIKEFNQWVCDHPRLEQVVLPVRDGISLIRQRGSACGVKAATATGGNLVQYDDTWHIQKEGETAPANALASNCRIDAAASEYADKAGDADGPRAWMSKSMISFDYRVVEVPRGKLLDPACDALVFGHLPFGSPEREAAVAKPQRRLIVIDETVDSLYGEKVRAYFEARGVAHEILRLPLVEENKSVEMTLKVCEKMKKFNIDRRTEPVIAIGGGVTLDVVGLAASLFRRRTPYIRVPTTALAYVDASVGAKNGCNFLGSKNRLGTYVPPVAALLDSSFFKTQQRREVSNSLGEMAKMAIMKSEELFQLLEKHGHRLIEDRFEPRDASDGVPARVLRLSIETMLEELAPNLWEHSLDRLVDFGHAVGQNLEMSALGTEDELMHGEAVACDMAYMSVLSCIRGLISAAERDAILSMLQGCEVPVYSPRLTREFFKEAMEDRVQNSMGQRLPMPVGIGRARMVNDVSDEDFERAFVQWEQLCKK